MRPDAMQERFDTLYMERGPCCAGCDWWHYVNSLVGECRRSAPVAAAERFALLGIASFSLNPGAGHVMTPAKHHCGDFRDEFDWSTLPLGYRARIGDRSLRQGGGDGE